MNKCKASTKTGTPCKTHAIRGSDYCYWHHPDWKQARREASSKGGTTTQHIREINTIWIMDGHLVNQRTNKCLFCKEDDWGTSPCIWAMDEEQLGRFMNRHPYVYILHEWVEMFGMDLPVAMIIDTRKRKPKEFMFKFTSAYPMPKLPKGGRRRDILALGMRKLNMMVDSYAQEMIENGKLKPSPFDGKGNVTGYDRNGDWIGIEAAGRLHEQGKLFP